MIITDWSFVMLIPYISEECKEKIDNSDKVIEMPICRKFVAK